MITDKPLRVTSSDLERIEREDAAAVERAALEAMVEAENKPQPLDPILTEIEKLAAGDLVYKLRNASFTAKDHTEIERARIAQAGRRLAAELLDGAKRMERYRADDDDIPQYLRAE